MDGDVINRGGIITAVVLFMFLFLFFSFSFSFYFFRPGSAHVGGFRHCTKKRTKGIDNAMISFFENDVQNVTLKQCEN